MIPHRIIIAIKTIDLICWLCTTNFVLGAESPIVQVKNGTLEGTVMISKKGRELAAFRGIPYAQPPLDKLRFEPPKPFHSWTGIRSAKKDGNSCIHRDIIGHQEEVVGVEDCLYLNVYSPKLSSKESDASRTNYPVMIYLHGGAWIAGSSTSLLWGPQLLLDHDVILVTVNYRLGAMGFLSTEDLVVPGNQGLKDQSQAIRWVYENIAAFKGDVNQITIFGHSAGGASVHHQMMSPLSRGLFHRAISQSGAVLCPWAVSRPGLPRRQASKVGKVLNCPTDESAALVECLRKKDAVDIVSAATGQSFTVFDYCPILTFGPVIEPDHPGAFLKEDPVRSLKSGNVTDIPWMAGTSLHEGGMRVSSIFGLKDKQYDKVLEENFMKILPISLLYEYTCPEKLKDNVTKSIRDFYLNGEKVDQSKKWSLIDMYTDSWFFTGVHEAVKNHFEVFSSPVYYYLFAYRGTSSLSEKFGNTKEDFGVTHGDDLQYIFPLNEKLFPDTSLSKEDEKMAELMTKFWVNFATSGNPTPEITSVIPVKWKPVRTSKTEYLYIGNSKDVHMADNLFTDRVNFWESTAHSVSTELLKDGYHTRDEL